MILIPPHEIKAFKEMSRMEGEGITGCSKLSFTSRPEEEGNSDHNVGARTLQAERTA